MKPCDFIAWVSRLIALNDGVSDAEFVSDLRSFAAECGIVEPLEDKDIAEWFRLDEPVA